MAGPTKPAAKKTKIVILALSPKQLAQFPTTSVKSETGTPALQDSDKTSEDAATPLPNGGQDGTPAPAQADGKKKRPPPNPNARKRAPPAIDPDGPSRSRSAPKKKAKTDAADTNEAAKPAAASGVPAHKLGPKANTGAINAGLRALDRSGKPCRRWERKGLQLKSFTGSTWNMPTWKGSQRPRLNADGEVQSDSSSDVKPLDASGMASEKSASAIGETTMMTGIESSPAPAIAAA